MNRLWTIGLMWLEARVRFCSNCVCVCGKDDGENPLKGGAAS